MAEPQPIELSELIENLRNDLLVSKKLGEGRELRFDVEEAEIEVQFTARRDVEGKGMVKFYVIEAGGGANVGQETVQKIRLKLKPKDPSGATTRLTG